MDVTPAEKRNGWTDKELATYIADRDQRASHVIMARMDRRPQLTIENCKTFDPHAWAKS